MIFISYRINTSCKTSCMFQFTNHIKVINCYCYYNRSLSTGSQRKQITEEQKRRKYLLSDFLWLFNYRHRMVVFWQDTSSSIFTTSQGTTTLHGCPKLFLLASKKIMADNKLRWVPSPWRWSSTLHLEMKMYIFKWVEVGKINS